MAGGSDGGEGRARGDVVGGTFPHSDMVTPSGGNFIFYFIIFRKFCLRVLTRGRTAIVISGSYRRR